MNYSKEEKRVLAEEHNRITTTWLRWTHCTLHFTNIEGVKESLAELFSVRFLADTILHVEYNITRRRRQRYRFWYQLTLREASLACCYVSHRQLMRTKTDAWQRLSCYTLREVKRLRHALTVHPNHKKNFIRTYMEWWWCSTNQCRGHPERQTTMREGGGA